MTPDDPKDRAAGHEPAATPPADRDAWFDDDALDEPGPSSAGAGRRSGWKTWLAAGSATVVVVLVGAFVVGRSGGHDGNDSTTGGPGPGGGGAGFPGAAGTIAEIDGARLVVDATDQTGSNTSVTVETTDETVMTEIVEGSSSDLAVGDNVVVTGEESDGGDIVAAAITDSGELEGQFRGGSGGGGPMPGADPPDNFEPPEGFTPPDDFTPPEDGQGPPGTGQGGPGAAPGGFVAGAITDIDGEEMTVETADGETVTVALSSDTNVSVTRSLSLDDLVVGDTIRVVGETSGSKVTASSIQRGEFGFPGRPGDAPEAGSGGDDSTGSSS